MRILVVEDDPDLLYAVACTLRDEGYAVDTAEDGEEGLFKATSWEYDAVVLDVMLPKLDGWSLLERLRRMKTVPVLMLTAKDRVSDRVRGLDGGADDYLVKPFELSELRARLRALIRRAAGQSHPVIEVKGIVIDTRSRSVTRNGVEVELTGREYALVELLALHAGRLVTRTMIYEHLYGEDDDSLSNLVEVHVSNVRKKLGHEFITTRRGHGYLIAQLTVRTLPSMFRSIRWTLQMWHAAILATVLIAFAWVVFHFVMRQTMYQHFDADLNKQADRVAFSLPRFGQPPRESRSNLENDLQNLTNALNSDNLQAAKQAFAQLQKDVPGRRRLRAREIARTESEGKRTAGPDEGESKGDAISRPATRAEASTKEAELPRESGPRRFRTDRGEIRLELADDLKQMFEEEADSPYYYILWHGDGENLLRSKFAPEVALPVLPVRERMVGKREPPIHQIRAHGEFREAIHQWGGTNILVGRSIKNDLAALHERGLLLAAAGLSVLALGLIGGHWFSRRAIKPIEAISAAAADISLSNLSRRIDVTGTETELSSLARTLNQMFDRLESSFGQQVRFTADASHELRTPLAVILSHTELALGKNRSAEELRETIETCRRSAQRMKSLVESLLTLARFDSGELRLERRTFDLSRTVGDCVALVRPLAEQRKISFQLDLPSINVTADLDRMAQVATNLLSNAIRYNRDQGQVSVAIRATDQETVMSVSDTGIGIPPDHLPHIFDRFYRVDSARSRKDGAIGLGLAICQSIVEAHRGTISVSSTLNRGTTFEVHLPKNGTTAVFDDGRRDADARTIELTPV